MTSNDTDKTPLLSSEIPENPIVLPSSTQQLSSSQLLAKPSSSSTTASTSSITPTPSLVSLKQPTLSPSSNTAKTNSKLVKSNKIGLQRTSRTSQKLKLLPEDPDLDIINTLSGKDGDNDDDDDDDDENAPPTRVYSQVKKITDTSARKDAETLNKLHRDLLPRVTAYCTCGSYRMKELLRWLKDKRKSIIQVLNYLMNVYIPHSLIKIARQ